MFYKIYQPSNCVKCDYETICIFVPLRDISNPLGCIRPKKLVFTCYINEGCESSTSQNQVRNISWESLGRSMNKLLTGV